MRTAQASTRWDPRDRHYEQVVRETFDCQNAMKLIGARMAVVAAGFVEIRLPFRDELTQQHKVLHGGVVMMALDSACAFAAATLLPPEATGATVEAEVKFLEPAGGSELVVRGRVLRPGRSLTHASGQAYVLAGGEEKLVAVATETLYHFTREQPGT